MFQIGDKIFYPMHGAGEIKAIEEREILGEKQPYYIIKMPIGNMQVLVPVGKAENLGLRLIDDISTLENTLLVFHNQEPDTSLPWNQRFRINVDKIKNGDMHEGAEVIRDLLCRKKEKALNASEKKMLDTATKFLVSELALIKGITADQATDLLNDVVTA